MNINLIKIIHTNAYDKICETIYLKLWDGYKDSSENSNIVLKNLTVFLLYIYCDILSIHTVQQLPKHVFTFQ